MTRSRRARFRWCAFGSPAGTWTEFTAASLLPRTANPIERFRYCGTPNLDAQTSPSSVSYPRLRSSERNSSQMPREAPLRIVTTFSIITISGLNSSMNGSVWASRLWSRALDCSRAIGQLALDELGEGLTRGADREEQRSTVGHFAIAEDQPGQLGRQLALLSVRVFGSRGKHVVVQKPRLSLVQGQVPVVLHVGTLARSVVVDSADHIPAGVQETASRPAGPAVEIQGQKPRSSCCRHNRTSVVHMTIGPPPI